MALAFVAGMVVAGVIPILVLASGLIDWSASVKPGRFETAVAGYAFERSMQSRAPKISNPASAPGDIAVGLDHYRENCVICHGAPGIERSEAGKGLNPPAPGLDDPDVQQLTDGQVFWIVRNGIRMSGMPAFGITHNDSEVWQIVSFVRHLPKLTEDEKNRLKPTSSDGEHHH